MIFAAKFSRMIFENTLPKYKHLSVAWVKTLEVHKILTTIAKFLRNIIFWKTFSQSTVFSLTIKRDIFQGNTLSHLLFYLA